MNSKNKYKRLVYEEVLQAIDDEVFNAYCDFCLNNYEYPFAVTVKCACHDVFYYVRRDGDQLTIIQTHRVNDDLVTKTKKINLLR